METKEFLERKENWLDEVAKGCHDIAKRGDDYPDFYVFQSKIFENPDLLIVGANPAGSKTYKEMLEFKSAERGFKMERRTKDDLINGENQYLANPDWKIANPILAMFGEKTVRNSLVMNSVYFNTPNVSGFSEFKSDKSDMINFCALKTKEFIYEICKPKAVLFNGMDSPKWMGIKFDKEEDIVLKSADGLFLVKEKEIEGIRHFLIYHTSRNYKYNTGENLRLKAEFFKSVFG